jgi:hypothetical protein
LNIANFPFEDQKPFRVVFVMIRHLLFLAAEPQIDSEQERELPGAD